jgi:hypothetical protein
MLLGELTPVEMGRLGAVFDADMMGAAKAQPNRPLVVQAGNRTIKFNRAITPEDLQKIYGHIRQAISVLTANPGASAETVLRGLGDGDDLGWAFLIPLLAPLIQGKIQQRMGASMGTGTPAGGAAQGDILSMLGPLLSKIGGGSGQVVAQTAGGTAGGGFQPATMTQEQVTATVNRILAEKTVAKGPPPGSTTSTGCAAGDLYSPKYNLCYDPSVYATEEEAYQSTRPVKATGPAAATGTPQAQPQPAASGGGRKRGRKHRGGRRGRKLRGIVMNGVYLGDVDDLGDDTELGALSGKQKVALGLVGIGAVLAAIGTTIAIVRSRARRPLRGTRRRRAPVQTYS